MKSVSLSMSSHSNAGGTYPFSTSASGNALSISNRSLLIIILAVAFVTSLLSTFMMAHLPIAHTVMALQKSGGGDGESHAVASASGDVAGGAAVEVAELGGKRRKEGALSMGDVSLWLQLLRVEVRTVRVGCRELDARAQTCVFEGVVCVNVSRSAPLSRPSVILVDDTQRDGTPVISDDWCKLRHKSADPRYFSSRHWPLLTDTVAPQRSCLDAHYRTSSSLFDTAATNTTTTPPAPSDNGLTERMWGDMDFMKKYYREKRASVDMSRVKWVPSLSLVDLDYADNSHNNHLVKDILWLLDIDLFQDSLDIQPHPAHPHHSRAADSHHPAAPSAHLTPDDHSDSPTSKTSASGSDGERESEEREGLNERYLMFRRSKHIYLPQSREQFEKQTSRDVNRLTYSIILRKNLTSLYPNITKDDLHTAPISPRKTTPLLCAYPELLSKTNSTNTTSTTPDNGRESDGELIFHQDKVLQDNETELICTRRMMVGAKIGNGAHERVCREIRTRAFELYGIQRPPMRSRGQITFPQPPRSILVLDRHVSRKFGNAQQLLQALLHRFEPLGVAVNYLTTANMTTAEQFVRVYSSAGVIITPHGSHNMGQLFMHRYSALVEVMPVGYTDYAFNLLSESCQIWYYELQSSVPKDLIKYYDEKCGKYVPHMLNPCTSVKGKAVWVNISKVLDITTTALERLGHDTETWLSDTHDTTR